MSAAMEMSARHVLSSLQWAHWGLDTLLGGAGDEETPMSDPALRLLWHLSWGACHDNMVKTAREPVRQR